MTSAFWIIVLIPWAILITFTYMFYRITRNDKKV